MRLRKPMAALALACVAAAGGAAFGQEAAQAPPADNPLSADVQVQPAPPASGDVLVQPAPSQQPRQVEVRIEPLEVETDTFAFAQAEPEQPGQPPQPDDGKGDRDMIELYRAHFGGKLVKAPYLGVSTSTVPDALRQHLGLAEGTGLVVDFVEKDSPAQSAGLKRFDILTKLDDQILVNAQQLAVLVRSKKADQEVKLTLIRAGKEQSLSAKLVEKEVKPLPEIGFGFWEEPAPMRLDVVKPAEPADAKPKPDAPPERRANRSRGRGDRLKMVWRDNDSTVTVTQSPENPHKHVVVTDKSGKVLFDGDVDEPKSRDNLPPGVADKLKQLEGTEGGAGDPFRQNNAEVRFDSGGDKREVELRFDDGKPEKRSAAPIRKDDLIQIEISSDAAPGAQTVKLARVRDGEVKLPQGRTVKVEGMTPDQVERNIARVYAEARTGADVTVRVERVGNADKNANNDARPKP